MSDVDALRKIIVEEDPKKPSLRINETTLEEFAVKPSITSAELKRRRRAIQGDLDWIVMKALEKDRERRYASANDFAADIDRYLNNESVVAAAPTSFYLVSKFLRRNRAAVSVAAMIFALMAVATTVGAILAQWAMEAQGESRVSSPRLNRVSRITPLSRPWHLHRRRLITRFRCRLWP